MPALVSPEPSCRSATGRGQIYTLKQTTPYWQGPGGEEISKRAREAQNPLREQKLSSAFLQIRKLDEYLKRVSSSEFQPPLVLPETSKSAFRIWSELWQLSGHTLAVPDASPGPDKQILYTWDEKEHHL